MATLTFTFDDTIKTRVIDGLASAFGYSSTIINSDGLISPNPETKNSFIQRRISTFLVDTIASSEATVSAESARTAALIDAKIKVIIQ